MIDYLALISNYLENYESSKQLKFISGKYYINNQEIKDPIAYILNSDIYKDIVLRSMFLGDVKNIDDIKKWLENYIAYPSKNVDLYGTWLPPKYAIIESLKKMNKEEVLSTYNNLPFKLNEKELVLINSLLFHKERELIYILYGIGGSGKSTFLNLIKQLFNNDVSPASIDDLSNEFILSEAVKHQLICSDEINTSNFNNGKLKILASKQLIQLNEKNKTPITIKSQSTLLFACNKPPKLDISDSGILRRVLYYYKNNKIDNPNPNLKDYKFTDKELYAIANIAYQLELKNKSDLSIFNIETHNILMSNNSVYLSHVTNYDDYRMFCIKKGYKPFNEINFYEILETFKTWGGIINEVSQPTI